MTTADPGHALAVDRYQRITSAGFS
jgi:hypothetical protein